MTKTTKSKMLSFLLCFVMIATTFCQTAMTAQAAGTKDITVTDAQGTAVQDVTLPKNGPKDQKTKLTARAGVSADAKYQWQILADADSELWVDIRGEKAAEISVSYPMVRNLIDKDTGSTSLRCKIKDGDKKLTSDAVKVTAGEKVRAEAAAHPTKAEIRKAAAKTATDPTPQADDGAAVNDGEVSNCIVTINYVFENGTQAANPWTASIAKGSDLKQDVTSPTVVGYTPDKEVVNIDIKSISEDTTYTVTYKPALVEYTVKHYQQNVDDDKYTLKDTETKKGYTESAVGEGLATTYEGFTALLYDTTTKIASDGSTVVEIYYDRNYYLMSFDLDGGYGVEPIYARYGTPIGNIDDPTKAGYTFKGWKQGDQVTKLPDTMPAENRSYTATWTGNDVDFTVVFWYENADDTNYSYAGSTTINNKSAGDSVKSGDYSSSTYFADLDTTHFTYNADKAETVKIKGDGSTVLNVYYTRNTYTLKFRELNCNRWHTHSDSCYKVWKTINAKYQQDIHSDFPIKDGNDTIWWDVPDNCISFKSDTQLGSIDTMPGENITFEKNDSESGADIYYYIEALNGKTGEYSHGGKTFNLYKTISTNKYVQLTYTEEFHDIKGFTQWWSDPAFDKMEKGGVAYAGTTWGGKYYINEKNYLCYTRNSYNLKFYNHNGYVDSAEKSVQYEAPLKGYDNFTPYYPSNLEPNAYEFAGWYTSPGCYDGSEVDWNNMTMPASDLTLYAKWVPVKHNVNCYLDKDTLDSGGDVISGDNYSQTISHGSTAVKPDDPKKGNWTFVGWFYEENGVEKAFDFSMPVNKNLDLYAKWSSNKLVEYKIKYVLKDDPNVTIASETVGSALAGSTKTFDAKTGTELDAGYQTGYFPVTSSHSLTMDIDGNNEYVFEYVKMDEVNYTVRYLEKGTGKVLHEDKTASTSSAVITEKFEQITGYAPDAYQKRLVLSANEEENVLIFWYTRDEVHAPVQVIHWTQNIAGDGYTEHQSSTNLNGVIGQTYTESSLDIPGFKYNERKSNASGELTAAGLVLNLYYDRIEYPYEFKFLEQGTTDKELAESVTGNARYQAQVTQKAKDIPGYTLVSDENQAISIAIEDPANVANKNVRLFYYKENDVTINYRVAGTGGSVVPESETLKAKTGTATGSTPIAEKGYTFAGWYKDADCTKPVDKAWVDTDNKLTPGKNSDEVYENATYYAKFKENEVTINYKAVGPDGNIDNNGIYGTVKPGDETVKVKTGEAQGSIPEAKNGYRFVGWYTDEGCTNKVDDSWVGSDNKLTPAKALDGFFAAATYYAKFEKDVADLKIVKEGWNTADENQSFIFTITGKAGTNTAGVENTVVIHPNKDGSGELSAVLKALPVGEYTVTEDTNWSWRYTPKADDQVKESQSVTITASSKGDKIVTVTFKNERTESKWLNGSSWCKNVFKGNTIESEKTTTPTGN